jgi:DNA topoisomerase-1
VIPPAWTDVWICPHANGHIQATGRDAKGRKQYRYHPAFREVRESTKYEHMLEFAQALPAIRKTVQAHMSERGLGRNKVLATVVHLLETTLIRVGNADYAKQNKSYGLTTLRDPHVKVEGAGLRFQFKGKSGKTWSLQVKDRPHRPDREGLPGPAGAGPLPVHRRSGRAAIRDLGGCERLSQGDHGPGRHRQGFPHLGRHRARGARLGRVRNLRFRREGQEERPRRHRARVLQARQHPHDLPQMLRPSGGVHLLHGGRASAEVKEEIEQELREDLAGLKAEEAAVLSLLEARLNRDLGLLKDKPQSGKAAKRQVKRRGGPRPEPAAARA